MAGKCIARLPIFDRRQHVYGYELSFRTGIHDLFDGPDADESSCLGISDSLYVNGFEQLVGNRTAFIHFPRELLVSSSATFLRNDIAVIEIPRSIQPDAEVRSACRRLRGHGYRLALDNVDSMDRLRDFLGLVSLVSVDFAATTEEERAVLAPQIADSGTNMLAKNVPTFESIPQAIDLGFTYFHGSFILNPQISPDREFAPFRLNYVRMLQAVNRPQIRMEEIEQIIKSEPIFCHKLLTYLNSPAFGFRTQIRSIRHALSLLGIKEVKFWASLIAVVSMAESLPEIIPLTALTRAFWCEYLATKIGILDQKESFFLLGLLSMMDVILGLPMAEVLSELLVAEEVKVALLLSDDSSLANVLRMMLAYERGAWEEFNCMSTVLRLPPEATARAYLDALGWAGTLYQRCS